MRLWIRKSDIRNGTRKDSKSCPIALAAKRKFKATVAGMGVTTLRVGDWMDPQKKLYTGSRKAWEFVLAFDRGEIPNPGYLTFKEIK